MTARTDTHRPSVVNPEEYEFVAVCYNSSGLEAVLHDAVQRKIIREHMARTSGAYSTHEHGGTCHVCGAHANYLATFYHAKSNRYIEVGETCCWNLEGGHTRAFREMRKAVTDWNNLKAGKTKAKKILQEEDLEAAWDVYEEIEIKRAEFQASTGSADFFIGEEQTIINDIVGKLVKYGSLSEKQLNYVRKLADDITTGNTREKRKKEREARWEAERASAQPCPSGRAQIEGVVIKLREPDEYAAFPAWKMLLKDNRGFRVWGSVPRALNNLEVDRGDKVRFTAILTPSNDDPKFGFYKRPSNAELVEKKGE